MTCGPTLLLKLAVLGLSVWVSAKFADGYWVVGSVFGAAVLACGWKTFKPGLLARAAFFAASTLIYALVYCISGLKWGNDSPLFEYVIGPFPIAIVAGSILLPLTHRRFLGAGDGAAARAAAVLVVGFYLVTLLSYLNETYATGIRMPWLTILIAVWQGSYLGTFFCKKSC